MSRRENGAVPQSAVPAHLCQVPRWLRRLVLALSVLSALSIVGLAVGAVYLYQANQYVEGRGEFRDAESARLQENFRRGICDLLDTLPEGGLLDRPRNKYGCGPGIPRNLLTPEEQARLDDRDGTEPRSASSPGPFSGGAVGPPAAPTTPPAPTRPPMPTETEEP